MADQPAAVHGLLASSRALLSGWSVRFSPVHSGHGFPSPSLAPRRYVRLCVSGPYVASQPAGSQDILLLREPKSPSAGNAAAMTRIAACWILFHPAHTTHTSPRAPGCTRPWTSEAMLFLRLQHFNTWRLHSLINPQCRRRNRRLIRRFFNDRQHYTFPPFKLYEVFGNEDLSQHSSLFTSVRPARPRPRFLLDKLVLTNPRSPGGKLQK
jgi:hypothetical protein